MRRAALALVLSGLLAVVAGTEARPASRVAVQGPIVRTSFVISGRGYGHGVGMSQYGALGYAKNGATYDEILAHFYPGTMLGPAPASSVRVLLAGDQPELKVASAQDFRVKDARGVNHQLAAGVWTVGPDLSLSGAGATGSPLPGPLTFIRGRAPLELGGKSYRGAIQAIARDGVLDAVDVIGLEKYLYSVVPSEMPSGWPAAALQAQAVAARSYALASRRKGAEFELYGDVRSQAYLGIAGESAPSRAAVDATAGQVLLYDGKVATALFSSTSGGRTAPYPLSFPGGNPVPYLVSVPDPYDRLSPYHTWGPVTLPAATVEQALGVPSVTDLVPDPPTGRARRVTAVSAGLEVTFPAPGVRFALGLRSAWFTVGVLSLSRPFGPLSYGSAVTLSGISRGVAGIAFEQREAGASWQPGPAIAPAADGTFTVDVSPLLTTDYRLTNGTVSGPVLRVPVAPVVTLGTTATGLQGSTIPAASDATVELQRLDPATRIWETLTTATVDPTGAYSAALTLSPGTYRARLAPGRGLVPGVSPELQVGS